MRKSVYSMRDSATMDVNNRQLYHIIYKSKAVLLFMIFAGMVFTSCEKEKGNGKEAIPYDPNKPISVSTFMSDSGGIRTKVVIKGSNFGSDKSLISVYFLDNERQRKATVINMDNENIYCLAPKQNGGDNRIKVKIANDSITTTKTFRYIVAESVSNVVGLTGIAGSVDGSLADGRIQRTFGLAALGGDQVLSFEMLNKTVRYISINDNKITTLQTGFGAGQPAMNSQRTIVYAIELTAPHKIIRYKKENLWAPEYLSAGIYRPNGTVVAGTIVSAALDNTEEWLYFRDKNGVFGLVEIANPVNVQILNETCGPAGSTDYNYLVYSPVDDCFFFGISNVHTIYKVKKDGTNLEIYAGSSQGAIDAPRLEAKFNSPAGLAVDSEGNLYVMDSNNYTVRKINHGSGYVTRIAGTTGVGGFVNGKPKESQFSFPYCIAADDQDNTFIGESWGVTIRKLAIE